MVLHGCWVNVAETRVCKQMACTHKFARITAFPCGDGQLQQVNVQNTHIVCVTNRDCFSLHKSATHFGKEMYAHSILHNVTNSNFCISADDTQTQKTYFPLHIYYVSAHRTHVCIMCVTFPQVHGVSLTFVREVESRVIQDESNQNTTENKTYKNNFITVITSYVTESYSNNTKYFLYSSFVNFFFICLEANVFSS